MMILKSSPEIFKFSSRIFTRKYSTLKPEKIVIVSRSRNIFENLALEDWLYKNADLNNQSYLLMWKNTPAIVIGRHQNPWYECDVNTVVKDDVDLARRNSGGGAVYHDEGNLNCSFLMARKLYNRKKNLELVVDAVKSKWDVDLTINQREDIILNGLYKVSGTAAKLGGDKSYHHFTLLVDVDKNNLSQYLQSPMTGVKTKATASVISNVMNLNEADEDLTVDKVIKAISGKFLHHQIIPKIENVFPSEISFPGFTKILAELKTFSWIFGKTPNFTISKSFVRNFDSKQCSCELDIVVDKGIIQDIRTTVTFPHCRKFGLLLGVPYNPQELLPLFNTLESEVDYNEVDLWILNCIKLSLNL